MQALARIPEEALPHETEGDSPDALRCMTGYCGKNIFDEPFTENRAAKRKEAKNVMGKTDMSNSEPVTPAETLDGKKKNK
jgi:hypothetical protein